jgi:lipopolysaccharide transport system ATP-binding protein
MSSPAIKVEGIGKLYRLEHAEARPNSFRDLLTGLATAPLRRFRRLRGSDASMEDFWALQDVSFEVQPGEVVGIIGRNGAGKSTLLKVLSRIVEPTRGQATMRGRVASLLEVGTGFHPELTGRENVYLNGSILGMKKREIDARFDEIVEFAEISKFLDTPVKRYSSGMYVRLAFAVAAHLNPEILIVDEVLAVGDAEFQKKCLGKMKEVSTGGGRTVLFVSHNMAAVRALCSRGVWLRNGRVAMDASAEAVVHSYLDTTAQAATTSVELSRPKAASIWMRRAALSFDGHHATSAPMGAEVTLTIDFESSAPIRHPRFGYVVQTLEGDKLFNSNNRYQPSPQFEQPVTEGRIVCRLGTPPFMPGRYVMSLWMGDLSSDQHVELEVLAFEIIEKDLWGNGQIPPAVSPFWWPTRYEFATLQAPPEPRLLAEGTSGR